MSIYLLDTGKQDRDSGLRLALRKWACGEGELAGGMVQGRLEFVGFGMPRMSVRRNTCE